jgi:hypothetical protein
MGYSPPTDSEDESFSSADEADIGDEALHHLTIEVKHHQGRYAQAGRQVEPQKVFKKAFREFNEHK